MAGIVRFGMLFLEAKNDPWRGVHDKYTIVW